MEQCIIFVDVLVLSPRDSDLAPSWFVSMQALTLRNGVVLECHPSTSPSSPSTGKMLSYVGDRSFRARHCSPSYASFNLEGRSVNRSNRGLPLEKFGLYNAVYLRYSSYAYSFCMAYFSCERQIRVVRITRALHHALPPWLRNHMLPPL